jgi:hypothetical protein
MRPPRTPMMARLLLLVSLAPLCAIAFYLAASL